MGALSNKISHMVGVLSNNIGREELQPGDHIYTWRAAGVYAHHGIYIGEEKVIHFTRASGQEIGTSTGLDRIIFSSSPPSHTSNQCQCCTDAQHQHQTKPDQRAGPAGGVIISCLDCFLNGGNLYRFAYNVSKGFFMAQARGGTCTMARCDRPALVLHRAVYLLMHGFGAYSLFKKNCEDFAIYCKTSFLVNNASSSASGQLISAMATTITIPVLGLVGAGGVHCLLRYYSDISVRKDVKMVPVERLLEISAASNTGERS